MTFDPKLYSFGNSDHVHYTSGNFASLNSDEMNMSSLAIQGTLTVNGDPVVTSSKSYKGKWKKLRKFLGDLT